MNDKVDLVAKRDNETDNLGSRPSKVELGQWFWVEDEDDGRWLGCATAIGSNYVEIESAVNRYTR